LKENTWGKYEELRPGQIEAIREHASIAYIPWGALEWHSYHAPIGLDGIKAYGLCEALVKETGGVLLPSVYVGTDTIKPYKGFKHSVEHVESTVTILCLEYLEQLADEGFKVIVLITGHYGEGQIRAIQKAAEQFTEKHPGVGLWAFPDSAPLEGLYPAIMRRKERPRFSFCSGPSWLTSQICPTAKPPWMMMAFGAKIRAVPPLKKDKICSKHFLIIASPKLKNY